MHKVRIAHVNAEEHREQWLALRRSHLTATDWPKITGTSRWATTEDVVWDKHSSDTGFEYSLPMQVGKDLEPLITAAVQERLGAGDYLAQAFVSRGRMGFTPDLAKVDGATGWELAEIKVSVKPWNGAVPPDYLDQVKFQATVLGLNQVLVVHLKLQSWQEGQAMIASGVLPHQRLAYYVINVSAKERAWIEREAKAWWAEHIKANASA